MTIILIENFLYFFTAAVLIKPIKIEARWWWRTPLITALWKQR